MKLRKAIKRIAALGTGATMVGATFMGAMGAADLANYPAPFVQDGMFNAFIVLGESGQTPDVIGAVEIATSLQVASRTPIENAGSTGNNVVVANGIRVESGSQPLRLGMNMSALGRTTFTKNDLPILKDSTFQDEEGEALTAQFRIELPQAFVAFGRTVVSGERNIDEPRLHVNFFTGDPRYTMVVDFPTAVDPTNLTNEVVNMFGKELTTGSNSGEMTATKWTLYQAAVDQTFTAGQEAVVDVKGSKVTVRVIGVNTQSTVPTVTLSINGETESLTEGQTKTLGGQRIYVRDVQAYTQPVGGGGARLFIGSERIILQDGQAVEKGTNSETVDGTNVFFTTSSGKVSQIAINVTPGDMNWDSDDTTRSVLLEGEELVDPVFGTFKWLFANPGANPALDATSKSHIELTPSDDDLRLSFKNKAGASYNLEIASGNGTGGAGTGILMRGGGNVDRYLLTSGGSTIRENDYFVIGSGNNEYQRILQLQNVRNTTDNREITVKDSASGGTSQTWSWSVTTASGTMTYDGNTYTFTVSAADTISTASLTNSIYTDNDNLIVLPSSTGVSADQYASYNGSSISGGPGGAQTVFNVTIQERTSFSAGAKADDYGAFNFYYAYDEGRDGNDLYLASGPTYSRTSTQSASILSQGDQRGQFTSLTLEDIQSSDDSEDLTPWGTLVQYNSDSSNQKVDLFMPSAQSEFNVFVAPTSAAASAIGGGESGTVYQTNPINVGAAVLPNEVGDLTNVNSIVVGGPCVNSAAAQLMGNPANCAAGFEDGKGWVRLWEHPSGKVSMLVAGYSAADTRRAARVLSQYETWQANGKLQGTNVEVSGVKTDFTDTVVGAASVGTTETTETATV